MEAKEESNKLPVEGANTNNNKTWVFLGKPVEYGTKELEDKVIGVEAKEVSDNCQWRDLLLRGVFTSCSVPTLWVGSGTHQHAFISAILLICCSVVAALAIWPDKKDKSYVCPSQCPFFNAWFTPPSFSIVYLVKPG